MGLGYNQQQRLAVHTGEVSRGRVRVVDFSGYLIFFAFALLCAHIKIYSVTRIKDSYNNLFL